MKTTQILEVEVAGFGTLVADAHTMSEMTHLLCIAPINVTSDELRVIYSEAFLVLYDALDSIGFYDNVKAEMGEIPPNTSFGPEPLNFDTESDWTDYVYPDVYC